MSESKFSEDDEVAISPHADFKYNNRRGGEVGKIYDTYFSEKFDEFVYEVEFSGAAVRAGFELIRENDLRLLNRSQIIWQK